MDDVLKAGLHRPTVPDLILIDGSNQPFERTLRPGGVHKSPIVTVQLLSPLRNVRIASSDAKFIVGSFIAQTDKLNTGVGVFSPPERLPRLSPI